ncbi:MAG: hypothetical protein ACRDSP_20335 [Pseudonocardiaceae bacterium]
MAQAIALATLTATALSTPDPTTALGAVSMAQHLDLRVLAPMANVTAFTGFFLAITTPWGLTRHWWVLVKAAITRRRCRSPSRGARPAGSRESGRRSCRPRRPRRPGAR